MFSLLRVEKYILNYKIDAHGIKCKFKLLDDSYYLENIAKWCISYAGKKTEEQFCSSDNVVLK